MLRPPRHKHIQQQQYTESSEIKVTGSFKATLHSNIPKWKKECQVFNSELKSY